MRGLLNGLSVITVYCAETIAIKTPLSLRRNLKCLRKNYTMWKIDGDTVDTATKYKLCSIFFSNKLYNKTDFNQTNFLIIQNSSIISKYKWNIKNKSMECLIDFKWKHKKSDQKKIYREMLPSAAKVSIVTCFVNSKSKFM